MVWKLLVEDESAILAATDKICNNVNAMDYLRGYARLEQARLRLLNGVAILEEDAVLVRDVLLNYGAIAHGHAPPAGANAILAVVNATEVHEALKLLLTWSRARSVVIRADGTPFVKEGTSTPVPLKSVQAAFATALRAGSQIVDHGAAVLYPAKAVLLLTGCNVAPDRHVRAALAHMKLPGTSQHFGLGHANQWEDDNLSGKLAVRKLLALMFMAGDLWNSHHKLAEVVRERLPATFGDAGRMLDILLMALGPRAVAALHVKKHEGDW